MGNHKSSGTRRKDRPYFFIFEDQRTGLYWMIPVSSRVWKYKPIYESKLRKTGKCDTIIIAKIQGQERVFLLQNMCPVTIRYIENEYMDENSNPIVLDRATENLLKMKGRLILSLYKRGYHVIFPNVAEIEKKLLSDN